MRQWVLLLFLLAVLASGVQGQSISAEQAKNHVGEKATVCGVVVSAHFDERSGATFLNLDKPYPNQIFTAYIARADRNHLGAVEQKLPSKHVCVSGRITLYKDKPEIVVHDKTQIVVQGP